MKKPDGKASYWDLVDYVARIVGCPRIQIAGAWYGADLKILIKDEVEAGTIRKLTLDKRARYAWREATRGFGIHPRTPAIGRSTDSVDAGKGVKDAREGACQPGG